MTNAYKTIPFLLALSFCQKPSNEELIAPGDEELIMKNRVCTQLIIKNENMTAMILAETEGSTKVKARIANKIVKEISPWRNIYLKTGARKDLFVFRNQIELLYKRMYQFDQTIADGINKGGEYLHSADSSAVLSLLYWTLSAEQSILEQQAALIDKDLAFDHFIPSIDNMEYSLKDTVLIALDLRFSAISNNWNFPEVQCTNLDTDHQLPISRVFRAGHIYLLMYVPTETGHYEVNGTISISNYPGLDTALNVRNHFVVK
jgi:hypothetical protein